ncbi:MAG: choice-of-anchor Q domain-containing protein [Verrucomicrobiota bacterium]
MRIACVACLSNASFGQGAFFYADANGTNPVPPYTNWSTAALTIQDAVGTATPGSVVLVNDGVYQTGTQTADGITTNRVTVTQALAIQSVHGPAATAIDGGGAFRCIYLADGASLTGFTLTNGATSGNGGAVFCSSTNARLFNCSLINNSAAGSGGGAYGSILLNCSINGNSVAAYNRGGGLASCVASNCTITGNSASYGTGGGADSSALYNCALAANSAYAGGGGNGGLLRGCTLNGNSAYYGGAANSVTMSNCTLIGNTSLNGGGAFSSTLNNCIVSTNTAYDSGGAVGGSTLNNCTVCGNFAPDGGGAYSCSLTNCTIMGNYSSGGAGGADQSTLVDCQVIGNTAASPGGGAANSTLLGGLVLGNAGATNINNFTGGGGLVGCTAAHCTISSNTCWLGGAGANQCTLSFCVLNGNVSDNRGGGAWASTLTGCIIENNIGYAAGGGGVDSCALTSCLVVSNASNGNGGGGAYCEMTNCTVVGNICGFSSPGSTSGVMNSSLFNCIVDFNQTGDYDSSSTLNYCCSELMATNGVGNIAINPIFANPAAGDFHLQSNSPCINAGANAYVAGGVDLDGNPRIVGGTVDMGAYEFQQPVLPLADAILADYTNTVIGLQLNFSGIVTRGAAGATFWDFGDGTIVSNQLTIAHAWTNGGRYLVTFGAVAPNGSNEAAATISVFISSQTLQFVSLQNPNPVPPYTSWQTAATNIQDAMDAAYPGGTILVSNGLYQIGGRTTTGTTTNRLVAVGRVTVQSMNGPAATVIAGGGVFRCAYLQDRAVLSGFTLTNGFSPENGGGVWCPSTNTILTNCILCANSASGDGGGAFGGTLYDCTLIGNSASANGGGAFASSILQCVVTGNSTGRGYNCGGGLGSCVASGSVIANNGASDAGGGVWNSVLTQCSLVGNSGDYGGGASFSTLTQCALGNNSATEGGGADYCTMEDCILTNNSGLYGGGAHGSTLNNCTLTGNQGWYDGGGAEGSSLNNCIIYSLASHKGRIRA